MTDSREDPVVEQPLQQRKSLSWASMLILVFIAILLAAAFAYLLVNPFFHQNGR